MSIKWFKIENVKGVRYYEHNTRIYKKRKDRNFVLQYKLDGKVVNETLGWESDGWTIEKAVARLQELKQNQKTGQGPKTLAEKREIAKKVREQDDEKQKEESIKLITFAEVFEKYIAQAKEDKSAKSCNNEIGIFNYWIANHVKDKAMNEITPDLLEQIKKSMSEMGRAARTIHYTIAVIRQVFNYAKSRDLYNGDNPVNKIKKPSCDNRRIRFLTKKEANTLLEYLSKASKQVHDMALLSLHCGLRAGEIFSLAWNDVDFEHGILSIKDTKSGRNRSAIMTKDIRKILEENKEKSETNGLVFISTTGAKITEISNSFARAVNTLGFNNGVDDDRQKVVFHTLRHTYASWLVMSGVDLYTVQRLMGHSTISMTERYSHLAPDHLKKAVGMFEAHYT
ncbi:integrase [Alphaproteobacteria bacterium]|nr:integrase [Alphaproteobacteria bacterium]